MKIRKKENASVTVTLCLTIVVTAALIFSLAEAARFYGVKEDAAEWSHLAAESLAAGYQPYLSKKYDLFLLDGSFLGEEFDTDALEAEMDALLAYNVLSVTEKEGINLYHMQKAESEITDYVLLTDDDGRVFMSQTAKIMKKTIGQRAAEKILEKVNTIQSKQTTGGDPETSMSTAKQTLEDLKKEPEISVQEEKKKSSPLRKGENTEKSSETTDPFQSIQSMKDADGILGLVVPDGQAVSAKTISLEDCLLKRDCEKGTCKKSGKGGWYERILMQEFLKPEIGNFIEPAEDAALSYGTEYLIAGNESDEKNLKETVNKLLLLRETLNFLYLQQDKAKNAEAEVLAATLAGATANPAIIELVHQGILAAWAYAESVCDVRTLLAKGQVPLMKDAAVWKTQLSNLGEAATMPADDKTSGLSYQEYLDALLYTQSTKKIAYRGMDLMEQSMRHEEKYARCRMNHMITEFHADMTYEADTLFLGLFGEDLAGGYQFLEKTGYAYQ